MPGFLREHSWSIIFSVALHGLLIAAFAAAALISIHRALPTLQPIAVDAVVIDSQVLHAAQSALTERAEQEAARARAAAEAKAAAQAAEVKAANFASVAAFTSAACAAAFASAAARARAASCSARSVNALCAACSVCESTTTASTAIGCMVGRA